MNHKELLKQLHHMQTKLEMRAGVDMNEIYLLIIMALTRLLEGQI